VAPPPSPFACGGLCWRTYLSHMALLRSLVVDSSHVVQDFCCNPPCTGSPPADAFVLRGRRRVAADVKLFLSSKGARAALSADEMAVVNDTTIFVSSSARPHDDEADNARRVIEAATSVQNELLSVETPTVVAFDGLRGKPGVTELVRSQYATKIRNVRAGLPPGADVLVSEDWLHMANSLRCAMSYEARTRLVFVLQDDTIVRGPVDVGLVYSMLTRPQPTVELVRLSLFTDCYQPPLPEGGTRQHTRLKMHIGHQPCIPHPQTNLLHRSVHYQDRPHFATREHYERRVWSRIPRDAKVTPEQLLDQYVRRTDGVPREDYDWRMFMYGPRGSMVRELHYPLLVDDGSGSKKLVTREFVDGVWRDPIYPLGVNRTGRVTPSSGYAHSYLIHAYVSKGPQDVSPHQIRTRKFRTENPIWMQIADGLWNDTRRREARRAVMRKRPK
jgi:hypothetical protein